MPYGGDQSAAGRRGVRIRRENEFDSEDDAGYTSWPGRRQGGTPRPSQRSIDARLHAAGFDRQQAPVPPGTTIGDPAYRDYRRTLDAAAFEPPRDPHERQGRRSMTPARERVHI